MNVVIDKFQMLKEAVERIESAKSLNEAIGVFIDLMNDISHDDILGYASGDSLAFIQENCIDDIITVMSDNRISFILDSANTNNKILEITFFKNRNNMTLGDILDFVISEHTIVGDENPEITLTFDKNIDKCGFVNLKYNGLFNFEAYNYIIFLND